MYSLVDKQPTTVCSMPITYFLLLWIVHYIFSWYKKELLFLLLGCERGPWICSGVDRRPLSSKNTTDEARTAILLRTEICISGAVKLRPLFQEVTKASQGTQLQKKLVANEQYGHSLSIWYHVACLLRAKWCGFYRSAKRVIFAKYPTLLKSGSMYFLCVANFFWGQFIQNDPSPG